MRKSKSKSNETIIMHVDDVKALQRRCDVLLERLMIERGASASLLRRISRGYDLSFTPELKADVEYYLLSIGAEIEAQTNER